MNHRITWLSSPRGARMKAIGKQMNRISKLLPPDTRRRADQAARTFGDLVLSSQGEVDYHRTASRALAPHFRKLTPQENDVLIAYVMFKNIKPLTATIREMKSIESGLKGELDDMKKQAEITSLRLQMAMDRRSKFISILSNMSKKISTTQDILVQNIK